jgi:uncharacterized membrane protein
MRERLSWGLYWVVTVAFVAAIIWSAYVLPDVVATHFGLGGEADAWSSRTAAVTFWTIIGAVVFIGMPLIVWLVTRGDGTGANIPDKEYWFAPENKLRFQRMFLADGMLLSGLTGLLLLVDLVATTWVAERGGSSMPWWFFAGTTGLYLVAMLAVSWQMMRRYRRPAPD